MDRSAGRETRSARSSAVSPRQSPRRVSTSDRRATAARGRHAAEDRQLRSVSLGGYAAPLVLRGLFGGVDFRPGCFFGGGSPFPVSLPPVNRRKTPLKSTVRGTPFMGSGE